ncbi:MAG: polyprenyl synthetase family protein [Polyangiales bacterium]
MKQNPADWPEAGPVDLSIHDVPHGSATTEWWYTNGHCVVSGERRFSYFAAFFRKVQGYHPVTRAPRYSHSLTWAIQDVEGQRSAFVSRVDQTAAEEGARRLRSGLGARDERLNRALSEIIDRGSVPKPDVVFDGPVSVGVQHLDLEYGGDSFRRNRDGSYSLKLFDKHKSLGCELTFVGKKAPIRLGQNGVLRGSDDESMFSYAIPRGDITGTITHKGVRHDVVKGQGWYDHAFGVGVVDDPNPEAEAKLGTAACSKLQSERRARWEARQIGWNTIAIQLDDGSEVSVHTSQYLQSGDSAGNHAVTIAPNGEQKSWQGVKLEPLEPWQSSQTFIEYPIRWRLQIPDAGLDLEVRAAFKDQEVMTLIARSSFYEGRVEAKGTRQGAAISGVGFYERSGFGVVEDLDGFFSQVGKLVRRSIQELMPKEPSFEQASYLLTSPDKPHYMDGVDIQQYARAHLHPIREIVDRGGKGWRSYAMNTCIDVVGGDSRDFVDWIAVPELMQTGSLIVDDVEDKSVVRRGGPAAHMIYGEPQAINSGTAAFFIGAPVLRSGKLTDRQLVMLYEVYFDGLRAGHAGQALDLDGFMPLMQSAVDNADLAPVLVSRVLGVHRLKTGAPAGCLARIGALAGNGSDVQIEALGRFFEDVGLAFQIVDDVLNLRGFKGNWKSTGEDVTHGKITLPVARGMAKLPASGRKWLFETLRSKPQDPETILRVVDLLEECGALEECAQQARDLVEHGWEQLSPLVEDSVAKLMLRAFGWYVIERHY